MKITKEMIQAGYSLSANVYDGKINKQQAINDLETKFGWNRRSASDCIVNFKKMMDGEKFTMTNNAEQTEYFLTHILKDYGVIKLDNAIKSVKEHLEYQKGKNKLNLIRDIVSRHEKILLSQTTSFYPDELDKSEALFEGAKSTVLVNSYERNPIARAKCIEHFGVQCFVCNFDFENEYGEIGKEFIHIHHLKQLSVIGQDYQVDPVNDLKPVCPNCHAMLHKRNPPFSIDELKSIIAYVRTLRNN
ncbi:MAG: HNH endonuclease [Methylococcaceae bacterium]|nr:HNH endonuclease [Methylococcaceae bacterium]